MDEKTKECIKQLYLQGRSIRQISSDLEFRYHREYIRTILHKMGVNVRGVNTRYRSVSQYSEDELAFFAELLGYMYGDGSLSRNKDKNTSYYTATLHFSLNEEDLVERVRSICWELFGTSILVTRKASVFEIKLKGTVAKYLAKIGYPSGKKSTKNSCLPLQFLRTEPLQIAFLRGFLNAEGTVNKSVAVQQSVRINLTSAIVEKLALREYKYPADQYTCKCISWRKAKEHMPEDIQCNVLIDLQRLLHNINIETNLCPVRVYVGSSGATSVHFELYVKRQSLKRVQELQLLTCEKKREKLENLVCGRG